MQIEWKACSDETQVGQLLLRTCYLSTSFLNARKTLSLQATMKQGLLAALRSESETPVLLKVMRCPNLQPPQSQPTNCVQMQVFDVVAALGAVLGGPQWVELLPTMLDAIRSGVPLLMERGLLILGACPPAVPTHLTPAPSYPAPASQPLGRVHRCNNVHSLHHIVSARILQGSWLLYWCDHCFDHFFGVLPACDPWWCTLHVQ